MRRALALGAILAGAVVNIHLPPPHDWRAAQARAKAYGLWLDLTMDGMFHVRRLNDNAEHATHPTFADALACVAGRVREKAA